MNVRRLSLAITFLAALTLNIQAQDTPAASVSAVATPAELHERSWLLLTTTVKDTKHVDSCIQALAALGTMGTNDRAASLIGDAMKDPELDIRVAAVLAAGQTHNPRLLAPLRAALDDDEPAVAYTAATTLWKLHDHAGESLLMDVADGDRRAGATLFKGARHTASRDLHSPTTLAKIGATQAAGFFLGPFGIGLSAIEYARKNGGDTARAATIGLLSEHRTPAIHKEITEALSDKDPAVRAAAARALGEWPDASTTKALEPLIDDSKLPVRLTAAAAYLRLTTGHRPALKAIVPRLLSASKNNLASSNMRCLCGISK